MTICTTPTLLSTLDQLLVMNGNALLIPLPKAAAALGLATQTARNRICANNFPVPTIKIGARRFVSAQDLVEYVDRVQGCAVAPQGKTTAWSTYQARADRAAARCRNGSARGGEMSVAASIHATHSGGVFVEKKKGRWVPVPEALLEDERLSLEARAVACWLIQKEEAQNWQIIVGAIKRRMKIGQTRWARIANELEAAGYYVRRLRRTNGRWRWEMEFHYPPLLIDTGT